MTPEVRRIREATEQRSRTGRAEAVAVIDALICSWCSGSIPAGSCLCRAWSPPQPDSETVAAAAVLTGEVAA